MPVIFFACGEDTRVSTGDMPLLTQAIHVIPETYFGASYLQFAPVRYKTIDQETSMHFVAGYSLNDSTIDPDHAIDYIISATWIINEKSLVNTEIDHTFSEAGTYDVILNTIDYLQDTLRDTVTLRVSSKASIEAVSPADGYNLLNPLDSLGIALSWKVAGIDTWETATCLLYAARTPNVWSSFIDTVNCNKPYTIKGPFFTGDSSALQDSSLIFYWGVKLHIDEVANLNNVDSSAVRSFRTALVGSSSAHIDVPVMHKSISYLLSPEYQVSLINTAGDTVQQQTITKTPLTVRFSSVPAQPGLKVFIKEKKLTEFASESLYVDAMPSSYNVMDTIILKDPVSPERWPVQTEFSTSDSIKFYIMDNGSGINTNKTFVILNGDTLTYRINNAVIAFLPSCSKACTLYIEGKDYAGNATSSVYWKLNVHGDSLSLTGPIAITEAE
jgi:hypothetical protein